MYTMTVIKIMNRRRKVNTGVNHVKGSGIKPPKRSYNYRVLVREFIR